jgi:MFS family permease
MKKQMNLIYWTHAVNAFSLSLIGMLLPIFFYKLNYTIPQILYYVFHTFFFIIIFTLISGFLSKKIGLKKTMVLRFPFILLFFILLFRFEANPVPLWVLGMLNGIQSALYWIPVQSLMSRFTDHKKLGSQVGKFNYLAHGANIIGPFVGGIIATLISFKFLFGFSMVVQLFSFLPLFLAPDRKPEIKISIKHMYQLFKKYPKFFLLTILEGFERIPEWYLWPIFIYIILQSEMSVGFAGSLAAIGIAIFTGIVGKLSDKFNKRKLLRIGVLLTCLFWILRSYFYSPIWVLFIFTFLASLVYVLVDVNYAAISYSLSKKENHDDFIILREIPMCIGRMLLILMVLMLLPNLQLIFIVNGLIFLLFLFF